MPWVLWDFGMAMAVIEDMLCFLPAMGNFNFWHGEDLNGVILPFSRANRPKRDINGERWLLPIISRT